MMELESAAERIDLRMTRERVAPAARIPSPAHVRLIETIADRRNVRWIGRAGGEPRMVVVDQLQTLVCRRAWTKRRLRGLRGVDGEVVAVRRQEVVGRQVAVDDRRPARV